MTVGISGLHVSMFCDPDIVMAGTADTPTSDLSENELAQFKSALKEHVNQLRHQLQKLREEKSLALSKKNAEVSE